MKISARTATIALVLAASAAGVALAQDASPPAGPTPTTAPAPTDSSANPSASAQGPAASSQPPADPAVQHVTNGPVPDTPASRAANGGPMSNGGQATKPAGN